jgi:acyl-coenzyme A thioesterase PaaI-like protein
MPPADSRRSLHADARGHFIGSLGFRHDLDEGGGARGTVEMTPHLQVAGTPWPNVSALLTFADVLIGVLASRRTAPRISITSDLSVRVFAPFPADGRVEMVGRLVKTGRSVSVGETECRSAVGGELLARALGTFTASPRPVDEAPDGVPALPERFQTEPEPLSEPFPDRVGLQVLTPGVAELALRLDLMNATESLQGGLVALLGEVAAQTGATDAAGRLHVVDHLDVRYLAAARVGPFRAVAEVEAGDGRRSDVRVEVRDPGRDDRLAAVVLATTRAVTPPAGSPAPRLLHQAGPRPRRRP